MTSLEKKLAFTQRKSYEADFPELFLDSKIEPIFFPDSSQIMDELKHKISVLGKKIGGEDSSYLLQQTLKKAKADALWLAVLPGLSPQQSFVYTKYPVLRVKASGMLKVASYFDWTAREFDFLAFFALDWSAGFAVDVYAGNSEVHGSDKPIYELTVW